MGSVLIIAMQSRLLSDYNQKRREKKNNEPRDLEEKEKISENGKIYERLPNDLKD